MDKKRQVVEYAIQGYRHGLNCAESIFDALQRAELLNVPKESIAMCVGFGGGIGLSGHTCGALSAVVMALGALNGRPDPWAVPQERRGAQIAQKYYRQYNRLVHDFVALNGSAMCRELTADAAWHDKGRKVKCLKIIEAAAALAYDYITMPQEQAFSLPYQDNLAGLE